MTLTRAYLSIGTNLGDRLDNLARAVRSIGALDGVSVVSVSPVYETVPMGEHQQVLAGQPPYLNAAVAIDTSVDAAELRARTGDIERAMGRGAHGKWESRIIDIDLVLYGSDRIITASLTVPHARMLEREFVLRPLVDLAPDLVLPGGIRVAAALDQVAGQGCTLFASAAELLKA